MEPSDDEWFQGLLDGKDSSWRPTGLILRVRRIRTDNDRLLAENERLRAALIEIGPECRNYADGCAEQRLPDRSYWCGGCVAREALEARR